jgi:hypothetical protein
MNDFNNQEKFVDTTGAIRSRKSNDRQYNGLTKKDKRTKLLKQIAVFLWTLCGDSEYTVFSTTLD